MLILSFDFLTTANTLFGDLKDDIRANSDGEITTDSMAEELNSKSDV
jgi:hypothetical protein